MLGLFKSKELCSHCRQNKTRRKDESGKPICSDCEIEIRMNSEKVRNCPVDGTVMQKEALLGGDVIIDRCPKCHGVWLDHEELETIREEASSESDSSFATGFVVGMALN